MSTIFNELEKACKNEKITSCLIHHQDNLLFSYYKNNKIENKLLQVNSVTKSVLSILIGIALYRKELESIHVPLSTFFPDVRDHYRDLTIEHLLTMTPGIHWPEFGEWGGKAHPMSNSKDWIQFFFHRDIVEPPGQNMYYNSGCSHVLSNILYKVTGKSLKDYAVEHLFRPLQIQDFIWHSDRKGTTIGGYGLYIKPTDMLKIGRLLLNKGVWKKKRIVSETWIEQSTTARFHTYDRIGSYGYHWWILTDENNHVYKPDVFFAMGYAGQYIIIAPELELVTVFTCNLDKNPFLPLKYYREYILKELLVKK